MDKFLAGLAIAFFGALCLFTLYVTVVLMPVVFWADAKCLKAGYPKSHVTIGLETYCSNLQGTVTVKVDKL